jgi:hypothetical protein
VSQNKLPHESGAERKSLKDAALVKATGSKESIANALAESKSQDWAVVELPGLNHLFQTSETGGIAEYATIDETLALSALKAIGDWLSGRFPRK